jgi:hypothetical protein
VGWNVGPTPHPSLAWRPRDDGGVSGDGGDAVNPPVARAATSPLGLHGDARHRASRRNGAVRAAAGRLPDRPLRRQPTEVEVRAAVDFAAMDLAYEDGVAATERLLAESWLPDLIEQAEDAVAFTRRGTVRKRLSRLDAARIRLTAPDAAGLAAVLLEAARGGVHGALAELADQGAVVPPVSDEELGALVRDHAAAVAQQTADGMALAASRRAVQVNAGREPGEIALEVSGHLRGLAHQWERDQLRGAVQMATNAARLTVFQRVPAEMAGSWVSSELLDAATCGPCRAVDGYEFTDLREAQRLYPTGGYVDCAGGPRCRGTIIAILRESAPANFPPGLGPG